MRILGIETSCDDTGIAVVEAQGKTWPQFRILSNAVASQIEVHRKYGGVYPTLAKREHQVNLPVVLKQALAEARTVLAHRAIDAIAITQGPGLSPCLWAGIAFAKDLAKQWNLPLVPVNHMEGHLLVGLFAQSNEKSKIQSSKSKNIFPAIALLVSGGHTQLILMQGIGKYELLGETRDDAAGEAFDKTARILGLGYPGGPAIAEAAAKFEIRNSKFEISLPRPMLHSKNLDFSFSGLKTAALYDFKKRTKKERASKPYITAMAKEIQQAIVEVLAAKTMRATERYNAKSLILGGGVAANRKLRKHLKSKIQSSKSKIKLFMPPPALCTDNGVMPALAGYFLLQKKACPANLESIAADPNLCLG